MGPRLATHVPVLLPFEARHCALSTELHAIAVQTCTQSLSWSRFSVFK